jgi:hypothetical protein
MGNTKTYYIDNKPYCIHCNTVFEKGDDFVNHSCTGHSPGDFHLYAVHTQGYKDHTEKIADALGRITIALETIATYLDKDGYTTKLIDAYNEGVEVGKRIKK